MEVDAGLHLDAVAHPALAAPPPTIDVHSAPMGPRIRNSIPWSATGFPALSVPVGLDRRGLPAGLSLATVPEREGDLLGSAPVAPLTVHVDGLRPARARTPSLSGADPHP